MTDLTVTVKTPMGDLLVNDLMPFAIGQLSFELDHRTYIWGSNTFSLAILYKQVIDWAAILSQPYHPFAILEDFNLRLHVS